MISISVLYARRYKSHHDIFPLRVHQSKLEKMNIKLSFYNDLDKNTLKEPNPKTVMDERDP